MKLDPKRIRIDGGTQPRAALLIDVMEGYAEDMRKGDEFPPITVFFDGKDYWLADGFHRMGAALRVCPDAPIEAEVIQGTQSDAQWYSFGVNKTHGLRRTNEDKARAVKAALDHPKGLDLSDQQIAAHVGVTPPTVAKYRRELASTLKNLESASRTGRDGRTIDTAKIGKGPRKKASRKKPGVSISRNAHVPKLGHSSPCPMIPLQFSPNNPQTAAATLWQHFSRSFLETLIQELSQRLSAEGEAA